MLPTKRPNEYKNKSSSSKEGQDMICPSCDTANREDAKFCKRCGHPFHTEARTPETAAVSQLSTTAQESVNAVDDPSLAPTQIISPQQMLAFHANRWQKDAELREG